MFTLKRAARRGDTIIEVMFAITVFSLVAVLTIAMMNAGTYQAEAALETVTVRNELNAQAEALRFIHSSYISERTLPTVDGISMCGSEKCQQYRLLWEKIVNNAISPDDAKASGLLDLAEAVHASDPTFTSAVGCDRFYEAGGAGTILAQNKAFVLNTRDLSSIGSNGETDVDITYISSLTQPHAFVPAYLNSRIIYTTPYMYDTYIKANPDFRFDEEHPIIDYSVGQLTDGSPIFTRVAQAQGIWVIAVAEGSNPRFYDFYIESCWYGPNTTIPMTIDTVIRLYNPENI